MYFLSQNTDVAYCGLVTPYGVKDLIYSTLIRGMDYLLMALSHYLNQP